MPAHVHACSAHAALPRPVKSAGLACMHMLQRKGLRPRCRVTGGPHHSRVSGLQVSLLVSRTHAELRCPVMSLR
jgi:hypothetical protein